MNISESFNLFRMEIEHHSLLPGTRYCGEVWRLGIANRHVWPPTRNLGEWCLGANTATILHNITTSYHFIWYHHVDTDNLLSSMSNKHFRKLHDIQLWRWAIKLPNYDRREAAKQHKPMILDHFATPVVWLSLSLSYGDETLNPWSVKIRQKPGILSVGSEKKHRVYHSHRSYPNLRPSQCLLQILGFGLAGRAGKTPLIRDTKRISLWVAKAPLVPF